MKLTLFASHREVIHWFVCDKHLFPMPATSSSDSYEMLTSQFALIKRGSELLAGWKIKQWLYLGDEIDSISRLSSIRKCPPTLALTGSLAWNLTTDQLAQSAARSFCVNATMCWPVVSFGQCTHPVWEGERELDWIKICQRSPPTKSWTSYLFTCLFLPSFSLFSPALLFVCLAHWCWKVYFFSRLSFQTVGGRRGRKGNQLICQLTSLLPYC